jgi:hypothetical protein
MRAAGRVIEQSDREYCFQFNSRQGNCQTVVLATWELPGEKDEQDVGIAQNLAAW